MKREGNDALVSVHDQSIGMDRALLPKVFDLFVQGERSLDRLRAAWASDSEGQCRILCHMRVSEFFAASRVSERYEHLVHYVSWYAL